jgi:hypothetical protein
MDDVGVFRGEDFILQFLFAMCVCGVYNHEMVMKRVFICGKRCFEFVFSFMRCVV